MIRDLQQVEAIEIITEEIAEWQKMETLKRLAEMKVNSDSAIDEKQFFDLLANDE